MVEGAAGAVVVVLAGRDVVVVVGDAVMGGEVDTGATTRGCGAAPVVGVKGRSDNASGDAVLRGSTGVPARAWRM